MSGMGEMVSYASNGGTSEGYLAAPDEGRGLPVIVIQEWWGLVSHIKEVVERFAGGRVRGARPRPLPRPAGDRAG